MIPRSWIETSLVALCLVLLSSQSDGKKSVPKEKCEICRNIVLKFNEGIKRTAKSNFGGGNTHWEEKSLGSFATSETRFVDITEHGICDSEKKDKKSKEKECHMMFEQHEEELEDWWFKVFGKDQNADLFPWFCVNKIKVCCDDNTYGPDCEACPGGTERPCKGNGKCDGAGTREGTGKCNCDDGYKGELCDDCKDGHYEESKNETHTDCQKCHDSCKSICWEGGPKGCDECKEGWTLSEDEGCQDVNECEAETFPCAETEFCTNTQGSFSCKRCNQACSQCLGEGDDQCVKCAEGYSMDGTKCTDVDECSKEETCNGEHQSCVNSVGSYHCECESGFEMNEEDNECIPKPPEPDNQETTEEAEESTDNTEKLEDSKDREEL